MLPIERPWDRQPQVTPRLNAQLNPLAVVIARPWGAETVGRQGRYERHAFANGTGILAVPSVGGIGVGSTTTSTNTLRLHSVANRFDTIWETPSAQFSALVMGVRQGNTNGGTVLFGNNSATTATYSAWTIAESGTGTPQFQASPGGAFQNINGSTAFTNHRPFVLIGTYDGATLRFFLDGLSIGTLSATGGITYPNGADRGPAFGNYYDYTGQARSFVGRLFGAALSDRAWSASEVQALSRNPWGTLLEPRRIWVPVSAGGGAYTLIADQGSYALTGQAANTLYSRSMPADQGSYALTGQAAGLAKGILLTAAQGSYALTGQAANFSLAYLLAAAQGSYALTGQSANTLYSRLLTAAQGSYALTGQDATLTYAPAGAYSMPAGQGSYALTGQDAALKLSALLVAAQGSYTLTGQAAALTFGKVMAAAQGSYALSGQAAAFSRTYALSAAFGSYTLSGQVATLTYAGLIAVFLETVRLRSRITQAISAPSRITQQLSLRSQVRH